MLLSPLFANGEYAAAAPLLVCFSPPPLFAAYLFFFLCHTCRHAERVATLLLMLALRAIAAFAVVC